MHTVQSTAALPKTPKLQLKKISGIFRTFKWWFIGENNCSSPSIHNINRKY